MDKNEQNNEGVDKTEPTFEMSFEQFNNKSLFGIDVFDAAIIACTALIVGGALWLAYAAVKEEIAAEEAFAEAAKKQIKLVTEAYSRGAKVLAGPGNSTWIIEGEKVELIY